MFNSLLLTGEFIRYKCVSPLLPHFFTLAYQHNGFFCSCSAFLLIVLSFISSLCAWSVFSLFLLLFFLYFCFKESLASRSRWHCREGLGNLGQQVKLRHCWFVRKGREPGKPIFPQQPQPLNCCSFRYHLHRNCTLIGLKTTDRISERMLSRAPVMLSTKNEEERQPDYCFTLKSCNVYHQLPQVSVK